MGGAGWEENLFICLCPKGHICCCREKLLEGPAPHLAPISRAYQDRRLALWTELELLGRSAGGRGRGTVFGLLPPGRWFPEGPLLCWCR